MNSEEIEKVLKYFMEPVKKGINWIMYSKYKHLTTLYPIVMHDVIQ